MESFTISLDIKEKECDVSGSIVGLEFIYQQLRFPPPIILTAMILLKCC
jgi:hypothetical protein